MRKILIVDDEERIRELIRMNLELAGYECAEAEDGEMAVDKMKEFRPDLALLDIMLPVKNGYEIAEDFIKADIPIIFLTADVFVAKIKRHLICTEPSLYSMMKEHYSAVDECYKDVTAMGGEYFKNLSFFNWAIETETPVKATSFRVPKMKTGSGLFYVAC